MSVLGLVCPIGWLLILAGWRLRNNEGEEEDVDCGCVGVLCGDCCWVVMNRNRRGGLRVVVGDDERDERRVWLGSRNREIWWRDLERVRREIVVLSVGCSVEVERVEEGVVGLCCNR